MGKRRYFTVEEKDFIKSIIPDRSYAEIQEMYSAKFDRPLNRNTLMNFIYRNKVYTGRTGQFQKGEPNPYKGKPRPSHWKRPMIGVKNGIEYPMYKPIGSTRKTKEGYIEIKATESHKWKLLHRVVWEKVNGSIPKNHVIIFCDGNKSNVCIENLMLISRAELAMLNKFNLMSNDAELTKLGVLTAKLLLKISKRKAGIK